MPIFLFDTLQFAKRMQKAGLQREIAEELAEILKDTQSRPTESFVTKHDLAESDKSTDTKVELAESKLEQKIDKVGVKIDLAESKLEKKINEIDAKIDLVESRLERKIDHTKKDLIIKLGSFVIGTSIFICSFLAWYLDFILTLKLPH